MLLGGKRRQEKKSMTSSINISAYKGQATSAYKGLKVLFLLESRIAKV